MSNHITCHACGVVKDPESFEVYPYEEDPIVNDRPISPTFQVRCDVPTGFKLATICHHCFHRLEPDMWTCRQHWEALSPVTAYDDLPDEVKS